MKKLLFFFSLITRLAWGMSDEPMLGFTSLHKVTTWQEARALIESGADINKKAAWRLTPLHLMVIHYANKDLSDLTFENVNEIAELQKIIFLLIEKGADLTAKTRDGNLPLDVAGPEKDFLLHSLLIKSIEENNPLMIKILCKNGSLVNGHEQYRPLNYSIAFKKIDAIKALLGVGANPHLTNSQNKDAFSYAKKNSRILAILLPFHKITKAMQTNSLEKVKEIVQTTQTIHSYFLDIPTTPQIKKLVRMHYAFQLVTQDDWQALEELIRNGLDVNAKKNDEPLLHLAVKKNKTKIIELLLRFEADPCMTDDKNQDAFLFARNDAVRNQLKVYFKNQPLVKAMKSGSLAKVKELLSTTKLNVHHLAIDSTPAIKKLVKNKYENPALQCHIITQPSMPSNDGRQTENYPTLNDLPGNL